MDKGGRPRVFESAEDLQKAIDEFFESAEAKTVTGLALFLGFESRQSLYDYGKDERFSYIIKRAKLKVENSYEKLLLREGSPPTGAIFALKNMGWSDTQKIEHSGELQVQLIFKKKEKVETN